MRDLETISKELKNNKYFLDADLVKIYKKPGLNFKIKEIVRQKIKLKVIDVIKTDSIWLKIEYKNGIGYIPKNTPLMKIDFSFPFSDTYEDPREGDDYTFAKGTYLAYMYVFLMFVAIIALEMPAIIKAVLIIAYIFIIGLVFYKYLNGTLK